MLSALIQSRLRYPAVHLAVQPVNQWSVQHGPLVLVSEPLKYPTPTIDRDRTVSRRSEPSSRATLMGEQPNPWDLLQPQDVTSRHRGAKPLRRYELLGGISLLSPEYLLSFERCPFHTETPDHYALVSYLIDLLVSQSSALMPLHSKAGYKTIFDATRTRKAENRYPYCFIRFDEESSNTTALYLSCFNISFNTSMQSPTMP